MVVLQENCKEHLASFLLTLNHLAFLFHTVLHLVDDRYQRLRLSTVQGFGFNEGLAGAFFKTLF
jgi:hypothetical protein